MYRVYAAIGHELSAIFKSGEPMKKPADVTIKGLIEKLTRISAVPKASHRVTRSP